MQKLAIDTNIFIYHFNNHPQFSEKTDAVFKDLENKKYIAITSIVTLTELLSFPAGNDEIERLKWSFLQTPGLEILNVDQPIAIEAAKIRRMYTSFRTSDAIQLATALEYSADVFITNDKRLKNFKEIKVKLL